MMSQIAAVQASGVGEVNLEIVEDPKAVKIIVQAAPARTFVTCFLQALPMI
jgi:hypothetical protein